MSVPMLFGWCVALLQAAAVRPRSQTELICLKCCAPRCYKPSAFVAGRPLACCPERRHFGRSSKVFGGSSLHRFCLERSPLVPAAQG